MQVSNTDMGPKGFSVSYTRDPPAGSALEPANDPDQDAKQEAKKDQPMSAFTDSTAMPTGAMRRMMKENGESFIMYGYFVPLAANLTRHFVMFARSSDKVSCSGLRSNFVHVLEAERSAVKQYGKCGRCAGRMICALRFSCSA